MSLSQVQLMQINKSVDKILHAPGNSPAGNGQLEMAFVVDMSCNLEYIEETTKDIANSLKRHDKIFQNVRSNMVFWSNECKTEVTPMSFIQIGKFLGSPHFTEIQVDKQSSLDKLCAYLKLFHARSKCIVIITDENYKIEDKKKVFESLNPFLKSRLLIVTPNGLISGTMLNMEMIRGE